MSRGFNDPEFTHFACRHITIFLNAPFGLARKAFAENAELRFGVVEDAVRIVRMPQIRWDLLKQRRRAAWPRKAKWRRREDPRGSFATTALEPTMQSSATRCDPTYWIFACCGFIKSCTMRSYSASSATFSYCARRWEMFSKSLDEATIERRVLRGCSSSPIPRLSGSSENIREPMSEPCVEPHKHFHKSKRCGIRWKIATPGLGISGAYQ